MRAKTDQTPPDRVLVPVSGLSVMEPWTVGRVTFHPSAGAADLIKDCPPFDSDGAYIKGRVHEIIDSSKGDSVAVIGGTLDVHTALDEVRSSLDVLRLFQQSLANTETTAFGLPGDHTISVIEYVAVWERSGYGGVRMGPAMGWTFDEGSHQLWDASEAYQFLSAALATTDPSEGQQRARVGAELLARATREHRPDLKMIGVVSALEILLLQRQTGPQTRRLARHATWFVCGRRQNDQCGRDRPICPYLYLRPKDGRLKTLQKLGREHMAWQCSKWLRVMDWYTARSDAAHGRPSSVEVKDAEGAEYWAIHDLLEPVLLWLRDHPDDPVGDLEIEINSVPEPEGWTEMLVALDSSPPPPRPPLPAS